MNYGARARTNGPLSASVAGFSAASTTTAKIDSACQRTPRFEIWPADGRKKLGESELSEEGGTGHGRGMHACRPASKCGFGRGGDTFLLSPERISHYTHGVGEDLD